MLDDSVDESLLNLAVSIRETRECEHNPGYNYKNEGNDKGSLDNRNAGVPSSKSILSKNYQSEVRIISKMIESKFKIRKALQKKKKISRTSRSFLNDSSNGNHKHFD